jgi:hypothetical protein
MKSSLPNYLEYGRSYDKQPATEPQQSARKEPPRLGKARAWLLLIALIFFAELALLVFQLMWNYPAVSRYVTQVIERDIATTTEQSSTRLAAMVDYYSESATRLASSPDTGQLFIAGDPAALRAREESLRQQFPNALNVRLLPPGLVTIDRDASPPLSYAALDQMRLAETGTQLPPVEVHLFGTLQQHISILRPVMNPASNEVVGHLMVLLPNEFLQDIFDDLEHAHGYIELQQTSPGGDPITVTMQGDNSYKAGDAVRVVPIAGSRWQVAYWTPANSPVYLFSINVPLLCVVLLISTGLLLIIGSLLRRLVDDSIVSN